MLNIQHGFLVQFENPLQHFREWNTKLLHSSLSKNILYHMILQYHRHSIIPANTNAAFTLDDNIMKDNSEKKNV